MSGQPSPFSRGGVLALVLLGGVLFVALLWMIGSGMNGGNTNDGGGHAGGKGLNGYAALATLLEKRGLEVRRSQGEGALDDPGLLVLTPPHTADGAELERIVSQRRYLGPTMVILPKWFAGRIPPGTPGAKAGWVQLFGAQPPQWPGFLDDVSVELAPMPASREPLDWLWIDGEGALPDAGQSLSGAGPRLVPLVAGFQDGRILAAYVNDGGVWPDLEDMATTPPTTYGEDEDIYPLVIVFEPDLLNNYGMAKAANAPMAEALFAAAGQSGNGQVIFDLTLNGHARSANLLTLAFTPPYLAATLCLLLAALAAGWRAFLRFGPAAMPGRSIAFGKQALVANAAGLVRRAGRLHLVGAPFADAARERLAHALALPRMADAAATEAAIDRALAARQADAEPFSLVAVRLRQATRAPDMLKAAQELHALERILTR
ncbi:MAG: hypothetical protein RIQ46_984 [Pseudomonadota bacterium]|jgi:hypothetical protein